MPPYKKIDEFAAPFNPTKEKLSEYERLSAALDFSQLIDDVFLNNIIEIRVSGGERRTSHLRHIIQTSHSDGRYLSHLEVIVSEDAGKREIQIREESKTSDPKRIVHYVLKSDENEVRRIDEVIIYDMNETSLPDGLARLVEETDNYDLEVDLGYNNQPIGADEVHKLRDLILGE
jgi:hypothetical protein